MPPHSHIYPFSEVDTWALEEYMTEALQQGLISRYTLPTSTSFIYFFVHKKDDGIRPCINYWGLSTVTEMYSHPLPLVLQVLCLISYLVSWLPGFLPGFPPGSLPGFRLGVYLGLCQSPKVKPKLRLKSRHSKLWKGIQFMSLMQGAS